VAHAGHATERVGGSPVRDLPAQLLGQGLSMILRKSLYRRATPPVPLVWASWSSGPHCWSLPSSRVEKPGTSVPIVQRQPARVWPVE
jgi:hypothetical protein